MIKSRDGVTERELDISNANNIMFAWSFTNFHLVPINLSQKRKKTGEKNYRQKRTEEILEGKCTIEKAKKQRDGILDSGSHVLEAFRCQGGLNLFNRLVKQGYMITDAWFSQGESEESKARGKGHKKFRVRLFLSREGKEMKLEDETIEGLEFLMNSTWIAHVWNNTMVNQGITINFTSLQENQPYETDIVLQ